MGMLLDMIRDQLRDGKLQGVERINARNRANGSNVRAYLDERGKIASRKLTPEELEQERIVYSTPAEDAEEEG